MDALESTLLAIIIVIVIAIIGWILVKWYKGYKELKKPPLEGNWQFYTNPTTLEPPGTIFRINSEHKRFIVGFLKIKAIKGEVTTEKLAQSSTANMNIAARFLGIDKIGADIKADKTMAMTLDMKGTKQEITTDVVVIPALNEFIEELADKHILYQSSERFFIIRECVSAMEINYLLKQDQMNAIGGKATIDKVAAVKGNIFASDWHGECKIKQRFKKRMRVTFLTEEIKISGMPGGSTLKAKGLEKVPYGMSGEKLYAKKKRLKIESPIKRWGPTMKKSPVPHGQLHIERVPVTEELEWEDG